MRLMQRRSTWYPINSFTSDISVYFWHFKQALFRHKQHKYNPEVSTMQKTFYIQQNNL